MRTLVGFGLSLLLATGLYAQHHGGFSNPHPFPQGTFSKGVFPGGATRQGLRRQPSVSVTGPTRTVIVYGYTVYVGGYVDNGSPAEPAPQQQPAQSVIQYFGSDDAQDPSTPTAAADDFQPVEEPASTAEPSHYLIAFKDHTVYSAVAYWVDGDILHYFTSANTHNQASLSLIDRDLTERLNKESGLDVKLPPPTPIR
jgi:hypothetical protein